MPSFSKMTDTALERHREKLYAELKEAAPDLIAEIEAVDLALAKLRGNGDQEFAGFRSPYEAIEAYLTRRGVPCTKKEIVDAVIAGGFKVDPKRGRYFLNDILNYHLSTGRLVEKDERISISPEPPTKSRKKL